MVEQRVDDGGGVTGALYERLDNDAAQLSWWAILIAFLAITGGLMLIAAYGGRVLG